MAIMKTATEKKNGVKATSDFCKMRRLNLSFLSSIEWKTQQYQEIEEHKKAKV
jgi:hypothetical protein